MRIEKKTIDSRDQELSAFCEKRIERRSNLESKPTKDDKHMRKVHHILEECQGNKISNNMTGKENLHKHMRNEAEDIEASRKGVANTMKVWER